MGTVTPMLRTANHFWCVWKDLEAHILHRAQTLHHPFLPPSIASQQFLLKRNNDGKHLQFTPLIKFLSLLQGTWEQKANMELSTSAITEEKNPRDSYQKQY